MAVDVKDRPEFRTWATAIRRRRRISWILILIVEVGYIAWGAGAAYDKTVNAIGPFELTEYLGLALVWGALVVTAPFRRAARPVPTRDGHVSSGNVGGEP